MERRTDFILAIVAACVAIPLVAQDSLPVRVLERDARVDFHKEVLPILRANCLACHNASEAEGDLVLESPETMLTGGLSGPAIVAGNSEQSLLFLAASHEGDVIMPPEGNARGAKNLSPEDLGLLKLWIDQGGEAGEAVSEGPSGWQTLPLGLDPIYAVAVTEHGRYVAAGWANRLFIYQVGTQRLVAELVDPALGELLVTTSPPPAAAHLDLIQSLDFSPDGTRLASGGFRTVKVWRRVPPQAVELPGGAPPEPEAAAASGAFFARSDGNSVQLIKRDGEELVRSFDLGRPASRGVVSPEGSRLVGIGQDGSAKLFNAASGETMADLAGSFHEQDRVAVAEQAVRVCERQRDQAQRDVEAAGKEKQTTDESLAQAQKDLETAEAALAEKQKAEDEKKTAQVAAAEKLAGLEADLAAKQKTREKAEEALQAAGEDATDELREALEEARQAAEAATAPIEEAKKELEKTDAELKAVTGEREEAERSVSASCDALDRNKPALERAVDGVKLAEAALEEGQQTLTAATEDRDAAVNELKAGGTPFVAAAFSPDAKELALADAAGTLFTYAAADGTALEQIETGGSSVTGSVTGLKYVAEHRVQVAAADAVYELDTLPGWRLERTIGSIDDPHTLVDRVTALDFHPRGVQLAVGSGEPSRSGQIKVFSVETGGVVHALEEPHSDVVLSLAFSPDGARLASGGADRFAKVFELRGEQLALVRTLEGHTGHVLAVAWHSDGRLLATASADTTAKVWDAHLGEQQKTIDGLGGPLASIAFVGVEDMCVIAGGKNVVVSRKTDGSGGPSYGGATDFVHTVRTTLGGKLVVAGGEDGRLRIWNKDGEVVATIAPQKE